MSHVCPNCSSACDCTAGDIHVWLCLHDCERITDELDEFDRFAVEPSAEDGEEDETQPCVLCGCLIGDEVGYGDDWGEGPICDACLPPDPPDDLLND